MSPNAYSHTKKEVGSVTCQICLEELPTSKNQNSPKVVTQICSPTCPAVVCTPCFRKHLEVSMTVRYTGALPKIRCPICLVPLNKQQWSRFLRSKAHHLLQRYQVLCKKSCNFTCPSCYNDNYTQLPLYYDQPWPDRANTETLTLRRVDSARLPELQRVVRRFCWHHKTTTARDVINYIHDTFPASKTNCIVHKVLPLIQDEERRATLLLAYHSIHRRVVTRCCGAVVCFNCKRSLSDEMATCLCEEEDQEMIRDEDIVQCRSCRVMLVKVDGSSSVCCTCGFKMNWHEELHIKKQFQRKLLPVVDPFDMTAYEDWMSWHIRFMRVTGEVYWELRYWELRCSALLHSVNSSYPKFREALRQFIWKERFRRGVLAGEFEMRHKFVVRLFPVFRESLRALVWRRRRFHRRLLDECRTEFVVRSARRHSAVIKAVLLKYMWYCRFRSQVLYSLRRHFYWADLKSNDQKELEEEELAIRCIGLN